MNRSLAIQMAPTALTLGNLLCGLLAAAAAAGVATPFGAGQQTAAWLVIAAMVFDGLDGVLARWLKVDSQFGLHLDSLADMVSFGVAPALLVVVGLERSIELVWVVAAVYAAGVALRLARFTSEPRSQDFTGLPCPAAALVIVSIVMAQPADRIGLLLFTLLPVVLGGMMLSRVAWPHPAKLGGRRRGGMTLIAVGGVTALAAWLVGSAYGMLTVAGVYLLSPLLAFLWRR